MMQSAKTSVFDDVSYRNILNENKKQADSVMPNPPLGVYGSLSPTINESIIRTINGNYMFLFPFFNVNYRVIRR